MVSVTISSAGRPIAVARKLPITVDIADKTIENATIGDVKSAIARRFPKLYTSRQTLSLKGERKALGDDTTLQAAGVVDGGELSVKDLGPQVAWRTVFIIEYLGPLLIHPLFYYFPKLVYGGQVQHSVLQKYAFTMIMLHFFKRELETIFLHRFSKNTMPAAFIVRNSSHYHFLAGVFLAFDLYRPKYAAFSPHIVGSKRDQPSFLWTCIAIYIFAELSNFKTHLTLRLLRSDGSRKRSIPYGYGFNFVSCPNYFFEILAWFAICYMTGSLAGWIFFAVGTRYMVVWAIGKQKAYMKDFGSQYPKNRKILIPYLF